MDYQENTKTCDKVYGPQGSLSFSISLPEAKSDTYPLVILMHGFSANRNTPPFPAIVKMLNHEGFATLCFDFEAHGDSEGNIQDMTISKEVEDAKAIYDYACNLPFVSSISLLGHSQGGLVTILLAGILKNAVQNLFLLSPAVSIKTDVLNGRYLCAHFNPDNPPEFITVLFQKIGKPFILDAQTLPIDEAVSGYKGKVFIIHGEKDVIVPLSFSQHLQQIYSNCQLEVLPGESHMFNANPDILTETLRNSISFRSHQSL